MPSRDFRWVRISCDGRVVLALHVSWKTGFYAGVLFHAGPDRRHASSGTYSSQKVAQKPTFRHSGADPGLDGGGQV